MSGTFVLFDRTFVGDDSHSSHRHADLCAGVDFHVSSKPVRERREGAREREMWQKYLQSLGRDRDERDGMSRDRLTERHNSHSETEKDETASSALLMLIPRFIAFNDVVVAQVVQVFVVFLLLVSMCWPVLHTLQW